MSFPLLKFGLYFRVLRTSNQGLHHLRDDEVDALPCDTASQSGVMKVRSVTMKPGKLTNSVHSSQVSTVSRQLWPCFNRYMGRLMVCRF